MLTGAVNATLAWPLPRVAVAPVGAPGTVTAEKVYWSSVTVVLVPLAVVTVISTVEAAFAGDVTVMLVALFTVTLVPAVPPNETAVAPVKLVPVTVTLVPPAMVPEVGLTVETVGTVTPAPVVSTCAPAVA